MTGRRPLTAICMLASTTVIASCFTTTADYRETAETFIVEDRSVGESLGVAFTSAACDEPPDQDVGTVFSCTAIDESGAEWRFDVEIAESDSVVITEASRS